MVSKNRSQVGVSERRLRVGGCRPIAAVRDSRGLDDLDDLAAFPRTSSGAAQPVRTPLPLNSAGQIAVDAGRDEWYVVSGNTVLITRAGQALAAFTNNGLEAPYGLAIRADRQVFVSDRIAFDPDPVKRFAAHPNGNAPPAATIINGSAWGKTVFGIATSLHPACSSGNTASCLFRDGFE